MTTNTELVERLRAADPNDKTMFTALLRTGMDTLAMTDAYIGLAFDSSLPRVRRWLTGESVPSPAVRRLVLDFLAAELEPREAGREETDDA